MILKFWELFIVRVKMVGLWEPTATLTKREGGLL